MSGAERSQRLRNRRKRGVLMVADLEITAEHVAALIGHGYLESKTGDGETRVKREAIKEAVQEFWNDAIT